MRTKIRSRITAALLAWLVLGTSFPALAQEADEPWKQAETILSLGTSTSGNMGTILQSLISEESEGRIYCNLYGSSYLGSDTEMMRSVTMGTISLVQCASSAMTEQVPELALLDYPDLFSDPDEYVEKLNGPLREFFQPYFHKAGLHLISWYGSDFRRLTSNFPIQKPEDLKRLKIRLMNNPYHQIYWQAVGAETIDVPYARLFFYLQQGLINAQENPFYATDTEEFYQWQPYVLMTNHLPFVGGIVMNKKAYDSLSEADQQALTRAIARYASGVSGMTRSAQDLEPYFKQVLIPDAALEEAFRLGDAAVEAALRRDLGDELVDAFLAIAAPGSEDGAE